MKKPPIKTLAIEVLFFVALAVFGFALVTSLLGGLDRTVVLWDLPSEPDEPPVSTGYGLYEARSQRPEPEVTVAKVFTPSVLYWADEIIAWSRNHALDPNLAATVMQIESCGYPQAGSVAGAMGLFQVMPFHFTAEEQPFDPDTNAFRGLNYLSQGMEISGGHAGLAMAGYNGGHGVISRSYNAWPSETQRYYRWGTGIYREASAGWSSSPTLNDWLSAGGAGLCNQAEQYLGIAAN